MAPPRVLQLTVPACRPVSWALMEKQRPGVVFVETVDKMTEVEKDLVHWRRDRNIVKVDLRLVLKYSGCMMQSMALTVTLDRLIAPKVMRLYAWEEVRPAELLRQVEQAKLV